MTLIKCFWNVWFMTVFAHISKFFDVGLKFLWYQRNSESDPVGVVHAHTFEFFLEIACFRIKFYIPVAGQNKNVICSLSPSPQTEVSTHNLSVQKEQIAGDLVLNRQFVDLIQSKYFTYHFKGQWHWIYSKRSVTLNSFQKVSDTEFKRISFWKQDIFS